jgi:hypothetical protein
MAVEGIMLPEAPRFPKPVPSATPSAPDPKLPDVDVNKLFGETKFPHGVHVRRDKLKGLKSWKLMVFVIMCRQATKCYGRGFNHYLTAVAREYLKEIDDVDKGWRESKDWGKHPALEQLRFGSLESLSAGSIEHIMSLVASLIASGTVSL